MNRLDLSCVAADSVNMPTANETLIEHLELLQSQGQDSIWVDDEAKEILRDFYINAQKKDQVSLQPQTAQQASPAPAQPNTQAVAQRGSEREPCWVVGVVDCRVCQAPGARARLGDGCYYILALGFYISLFFQIKSMAASRTAPRSTQRVSRRVIVPD